MLTQSERKTILTADVKTRAVVYCRVSTDEQAESGTSIEGQARAGADYATKAGLDHAGKAILKKFITEGEL